MSDRSTFPEGVVVHQKQLVFESTQRQQDVKRVLIEGSSRGVVSGLEVTVNVGAPTTIDVAAGTAYAEDGSFMRLINARVNLSINNTLSTVNYVCLVYDESQTDYEVHKYNGMTKATRATNAPRVAVMTKSSYDLLPAVTGQLALTSNTKDRIAIIAIVTGTGTNLTSSDIQTPDRYESVLSISAPINISGVTILDVSAGTETGQGTLTFVASGPTLSWRAPGDMSAGSTVILTTSQTYTLTSSGGDTILIDVAVSVLPLVNATDTIIITDLYDRTTARFTMIDAQHRSMLGSGAVSVNNPHGMTLDDLAPGAAGSLVEHQGVMHSDGIGKGSSQNLLNVVVNTGPAPDTMTVTGFSADDSVYINGRRITSITGSNVLAAPATVAATTEQVYLTQDGVLGRRTFITHGSTALDGIVQVLDVVNNVSNTINIRVRNNGLFWVFEYDDGSGTYGDGTQASIGSDTIVKLAGFSNRQDGYALVYIKDATASTLSSSFTITPPAASEAIMVLATVPWSGSANGFLGYGFGTGNAPNKVYDKRKFGTLTTDDTRVDAGIINTRDTLNSLGISGVTYEPPKGSFISSGPTSNALSITGTSLTPTLIDGNVVVNGKTFYIDRQQLTLINNTTNVVYITEDGAVGVAQIPFALISATVNYKQVYRIAELITSGGVVTTYNDFRTSASLKKNTAFGIIGLSSTSTFSVTSTSGTNTITGASNAPALTVVSSSGSASGMVMNTQSNPNYALDMNIGGGGVRITSSATTNIAARIIDHASQSSSVLMRIDADNGTDNIALQASADGTNPTVTAIQFGSGPAVRAISTASGKCIDALDGDITAVAGNLIVDPSFSYRYSTPRARRLIISPANFTMDILSGTKVHSESNLMPYIHASALDQIVVYAEVRGLPQNSVVTGVKVCLENTDGATRNVIAGLYYSSHLNDASLPTRATVCGAYLSIPTANTTFWNSLGALSNNSIVNGRSYYMRMFFDQTTGSPTFKMWGVEITYTYATEDSVA